ncbi:diguanylate cyclase domain-containing protein [Massilia endophytica]|uniref:diguanylate cyclase domain-containing protein n=1 Tax=Massilia endophytica TaxID=2899220 RepID=UPI001E3EE351|nr:diguanylate cyclase [Massilia endophytica]UGQ48653.1 diguanylate cyclase [Massilia endophytica]
MFYTGILPRSLKARMTSVVVLLVLGAAAVVTTIALLAAERHMKEVIGRQQYALLTGAAAFLDEQLQAKSTFLAAVAETLPLENLTPARLRAELARHPTVGAEFSNIVAFDVKGGLVANLRDSGLSRSVNVSSRPYFEQTVRLRRGVISPPFRSALSGLPVVLLTQPVFGMDGAIAYVIGGSIDLLNSDFFSRFTALTPSRSGFVFVMTDEGIVISHPDKGQVLRHITEGPGRNPATAKALGGFEGWTEAANRDGVPGIYSYRRLASTNWIVGARYPNAEAFAPMVATRWQATLAAGLFALLAGTLGWFAIHRMLRPLERLRGSLNTIRRGGGGFELLRGGSADEIGELGKALYELTAERQRAEDLSRESERRARLVADNLPLMIAYLDRGLHYRFCNEHYRTVLGRDPQEMLGRTVEDLLGPEVVARWRPEIDRVLAGERVHAEREGEELGRHLHLMVDMVPDIAPDGSIPGFYIMSMDITERKEAELAQAGSERRLRLVADHLPVLIAAIDREHHFLFVNAAFQSWLGIDPRTLPGRPVREGVGERSYQTLKPWLERALNGEVVSYEAPGRRKGEPVIYETTLVPEVADDGSVPAVYALSSDVTRSRANEQELARQAQRDALTGIANRRLFEAVLAQAIERARRQRCGLALAYLDIDHFKGINDSLGHGAGDVVLKEFASRLAGAVRASDTVARLAGDEFVIVFEQLAHVEEAHTLARKILDTVRRPVALDRGPLPITTSIGIAIHSGDWETADSLTARADAALYEAKGRGRDGYVLDPAVSRPASAPQQAGSV